MSIADAYLAHFSFQAALRNKVSLQIGESTYVGPVGFPNADEMLLPFCPREGVAGLLRCQGSAGWLTSMVGQAEFRFTVRVRDVEPEGRVSLVLPQSRPSHSVRLTQRHMVDGTWHFEAHRGARWLGADKLSVHDISCGGLGLVLPWRVKMNEARGRTVTGLLHSPDKRCLPVQLQLRHLKRLGDRFSPILGGCVFRQLGADNYASLARKMYTGSAAVTAAA